MSEQNSTPLPVSGSISLMLAKARQAAGLSQADVADELFLTTTFIGYIDDNEFERFPKPAFIKGYLRSYARIVSLDGDEVVRAYEQEIDDQVHAAELRDVTEEAVGSNSFTGPVLKTGLIGLGVILLVVILVWWGVSGDSDEAVMPVQYEEFDEGFDEGLDEAFSYDPMGTEAAQAVDQIDPSAGEEAFVALAAVTDREPQDDALQDMAEELSLQDDLTESAQDSAEALVEIEQFRQDAAPATGRSLLVDGGGNDELVFAFTDECWIEVSDANEQLYGDLNRAGDILTVRGTRDFKVLFGRATAVSMSFNGKAIDLAPYTSPDQTAKVRTSGF
jgi:cytoskeleton protein RodZ